MKTYYLHGEMRETPEEDDPQGWVRYADAKERIAELEKSLAADEAEYVPAGELLRKRIIELQEQLQEAVEVIRKSDARAANNEQDARRLKWILTEASQNQIEEIIENAFYQDAIATIDDAMGDEG